MSRPPFAAHARRRPRCYAHLQGESACSLPGLEEGDDQGARQGPRGIATSRAKSSSWPLARPSGIQQPGRSRWPFFVAAAWSRVWRVAGAALFGVLPHARGGGSGCPTRARCRALSSGSTPRRTGSPPRRRWPARPAVSLRRDASSGLRVDTVSTGPSGESTSRVTRPLKIPGRRQPDRGSGDPEARRWSANVPEHSLAPIDLTSSGQCSTSREPLRGATRSGNVAGRRGCRGRLVRRRDTVALAAQRRGALRGGDAPIYADPAPG